jgi:hypothetical protein
MRQRFFDTVNAGGRSRRGLNALTPLGRYLFALLPDPVQEMFDALERYTAFFACSC